MGGEAIHFPKPVTKHHSHGTYWGQGRLVGLSIELPEELVWMDGRSGKGELSKGRNTSEGHTWWEAVESYDQLCPEEMLHMEVK